MMNKQYNLKHESAFKRTLSTYHDGKLIDSKVYYIDEIDDEIDKLEADGYVYGYTQEEVATAKRRYERMLKYMIKS